MAFVQHPDDNNVQDALAKWADVLFQFNSVRFQVLVVPFTVHFQATHPNPCQSESSTLLIEKPNAKANPHALSLSQNTLPLILSNNLPENSSHHVCLNCFTQCLCANLQVV